MIEGHLTLLATNPITKYSKKPAEGGGGEKKKNCRKRDDRIGQPNNRGHNRREEIQQKPVTQIINFQREISLADLPISSDSLCIGKKLENPKNSKRNFEKKKKKKSKKRRKGNLSINFAPCVAPSSVGRSNIYHLLDLGVDRAAAQPTALKLFIFF